MATPFEVLGVDPDADDGEIVDAYRQRVKESHPDHGGSAEEFQRVQDAYARIQAGDVDDELEVAEAAGDRSDGSGESAESDGSDSADGSESDPEDADAEQTGARVEYLDYQAIVDLGWSLDDEDLFEKASETDLDPVDYGRFVVEEGETLLEAAEARGFAWPYACRGGACSNCAVAVVEGEMPDQRGHILPREMLDRGFRLSCLDGPVSDDLRVVFNVKHLPDLDELRLPTGRFGQASPTD
ncbi:ferredoxin Fer [Salinirubrum litoreum]|uniref:Ferredoxin Fer n=1 Tax=Salinirubrum litoreum TaxID=1126234 RepID=A0ABD5RAY4_9EURY